MGDRQMPERSQPKRVWLGLAGVLLAVIFGLVVLWAYPSLSTPGADPAPPSSVPPATSSSTEPPTSPGGPPILADDFDGDAAIWNVRDTVGPWYVHYNGFGRVGLTGDGRLELAPQAAGDPDTTHAAMVTTAQSFSGDIDISARTQTTAQLRTGSPPNAWEVGWVVWHHQHDHHFYYAILRSNGWELGKVDNTKLHATGPECLWPSYENCKYPGAQRFLATGSSPTFGLGEWHDLRVVQSDNEIVLWGNGRQLTRYVDADNPYERGQVGLYSEDANVLVDAIDIRGTADES